MQGVVSSLHFAEGLSWKTLEEFPLCRGYWLLARELPFFHFISGLTNYSILMQVIKGLSLSLSLSHTHTHTRKDCNFQ